MASISNVPRTITNSLISKVLIFALKWFNQRAKSKGNPNLNLTLVKIHSANRLLRSGPFSIRYTLISTDRKCTCSLGWWEEFCSQLLVSTEQRTISTLHLYCVSVSQINIPYPLFWALMGFLMPADSKHRVDLLTFSLMRMEREQGSVSDGLRGWAMKGVLMTILESQWQVMKWKTCTVLIRQLLCCVL